MLRCRRSTPPQHSPPGKPPGGFFLFAYGGVAPAVAAPLGYSCAQRECRGSEACRNAIWSARMRRLLRMKPSLRHTA